MMNKGKTDTTRLLTKAEHDRVLEDLNARKDYLNEGIKNMSVTLYTTRAQNQMKGYVENLNEVDKALTVFERNRVFVQSK